MESFGQCYASIVLDVLQEFFSVSRDSDVDEPELIQAVLRANERRFISLFQSCSMSCDSAHKSRAHQHSSCETNNGGATEDLSSGTSFHAPMDIFSAGGGAPSQQESLTPSILFRIRLALLVDLMQGVRSAFLSYFEQATAAGNTRAKRTTTTSTSSAPATPLLTSLSAAAIPSSASVSHPALRETCHSMLAHRFPLSSVSSTLVATSIGNAPSGPNSVSSSPGSMLSSMANMTSSISPSGAPKGPISPSVGGAASSTPAAASDQSAFFKTSDGWKRASAVFDVVWIFSFFVIFGDDIQKPQRLILSSHRASRPKDVNPLDDDEGASWSIQDLITIPLAYFLLPSQIYELETFLTTSFLRDVDLLVPFRRLIQQWCVELFSVIAMVDASVSSSVVVNLQTQVHDDFQLFASESTAAIPLSKRMFFSVISSLYDSEVITLCTPPFTFVEKQCQSISSILGDLSLYKNYVGLGKYVRLLSSIRVESNAFLVRTVDLMLDFVTATKGKKELKGLFSELLSRLLSPLAHTPPQNFDIRFSRNCEFLLNQHLSEWEWKPKYASFSLPSIAACYCCTSVVFFTTKLNNFLQFVIRCLPEVDRKSKPLLFASLHHVVGYFYHHYVASPTSGTQGQLEELGLTSLAVLRKEIMACVRETFIGCLRKQPLTVTSQRTIDSATEIVLLLARHEPQEALQLIVDLLPEGASSSTVTEGIAVSLSCVSILSDSTSQPHLQRQDRQISLYMWSSWECSAIPTRSSFLMHEEDEIGAFPTTPFCVIRSSAETLQDILVSSNKLQQQQQQQDHANSRNSNQLSDRERDSLSVSFGGFESFVHRPWRSIASFDEDGEAHVVTTVACLSGDCLNEIAPFARRLGCLTVNFGPRASEVLMQIRQQMTARDDALVKRLSLMYAWYSREMIGNSFKISKHSKSGAATPIADKERVAQLLSCSLMLAARYLIPMAALFADLPRTLLQSSRCVAFVVSSVIIPHFLLHAGFRDYSQITVARICEGIVLASLEDAEGAYILTKTASSIVQLLHKAIKSSQSLHKLALVDAITTIPCSLPPIFYHMSPSVTPYLPIDMQGFPLLDILDGTFLVLLGSGDVRVRLLALQSLGVLHEVSEQLTADADGWKSAGNILVCPYASRLLLDVCQDHSSSCAAVGCNWTEESKSFKSLSSASIFGRGSHVSTTRTFAHSMMVTHLIYADGVPKCLWSGTLFLQPPTISQTLSTYVLRTSLPFLLQVNALVAAIASLSRTSSQCIAVVQRLTSHSFQTLTTVSSSPFSNTPQLADNRHQLDCWRTSFCAAGVTFLVEPDRGTEGGGPGRTVLSHARAASASNNNADPRPSKAILPVLNEKVQKTTEYLQTVSVALQRTSSMQEVYDTVSFLYAMVLSGIQEGRSPGVTLALEFPSLTLDFVKKFLDDPVKSLARKDKRRALAYCVIAAPALMCCGQTLMKSKFNFTANMPSGPLANQVTNEVQLHTVKLFDAIDVLISILITGNFSTTVAGSNAPTSSSSASAAPQHQDLLRTGGVSPLAALPPVPSTKTTVKGVVLTSPERSPAPFKYYSLSTDPQGSAQLHLLSSHSATLSKANQPKMPQLEIDMQALDWSLGHTGNNNNNNSTSVFEGAFSIRLRDYLVNLFAILYRYEGTCSVFLQDRHRIILEFLFFNVSAGLLRQAVRFSIATQCVQQTYFPSSGSMTRETSLFNESKPGTPLRFLVDSLRALLSAMLFGSTISETSVRSSALSAIRKTAAADNTLSQRYFLGFLEIVIESGVSMVDQIFTLDVQHKLTLQTATRAPLIAQAVSFVALSAVRDCLSTISMRALWGGSVLAHLSRRLQDCCLGTFQFLAIAECALVFAKANIHWIDEESAVPPQPGRMRSSTEQNVKGSAIGHSRHTSATQNHSQSFLPSFILDATSSPILLFTAYHSLSSERNGWISESLRRDSLHFLSLLFRKPALLDVASIGTNAGQRTGASSVEYLYFSPLIVDALFEKTMLPHAHALYNRNRHRNGFNRLLDTAIHFLVYEQRVEQDPCWVIPVFQFLSALMPYVELGDEKFKLLVSVSRRYRLDISDNLLMRLWSRVDYSSGQNKKRIAFRLLVPTVELVDQQWILQILDEHYSLVRSLRLRGEPCKHGPSHFGSRRYSHLSHAQSEESGSLFYLLFLQGLQQLESLRMDHSQIHRAASSTELNDEQPAGKQSVKESIWEYVRTVAVMEKRTDMLTKTFSMNTSTASVACPHFHESPISSSSSSGSTALHSLITTESMLPQLATILSMCSPMADFLFVRPLTSVMHTFSVVAPHIIHDQLAMCDAAVEMGYVQSIPKHLYMNSSGGGPPPMRSTAAKGSGGSALSDWVETQSAIAGGLLSKAPRMQASNTTMDDVESVDSDNTIFIHTEESTPFVRHNNDSEATTFMESTAVPPLNSSINHTALEHYLLEKLKSELLLTVSRSTALLLIHTTVFTVECVNCQTGRQYRTDILQMVLRLLATIEESENVSMSFEASSAKLTPSWAQIVELLDTSKPFGSSSLGSRWVQANYLFLLGHESGEKQTMPSSCSLERMLICLLRALPQATTRLWLREESHWNSNSSLLDAPSSASQLTSLFFQSYHSLISAALTRCLLRVSLQYAHESRERDLSTSTLGTFVGANPTHFLFQPPLSASLFLVGQSVSKFLRANVKQTLSSNITFDRAAQLWLSFASASSASAALHACCLSTETEDGDAQGEYVSLFSENDYLSTFWTCFALFLSPRTLPSACPLLKTFFLEGPWFRLRKQIQFIPCCLNSLECTHVLSSAFHVEHLLFLCGFLHLVPWTADGNACRESARRSMYQLLSNVSASFPDASLFHASLWFIVCGDQLSEQSPSTSSSSPDTSQFASALRQLVELTKKNGSLHNQADSFSPVDFVLSGASEKCNGVSMEVILSQPSHDIVDHPDASESSSMSTMSFAVADDVATTKNKRATIAADIAQFQRDFIVLLIEPIIFLLHSFAENESAETMLATTEGILTLCRVLNVVDTLISFPRLSFVMNHMNFHYGKIKQSVRQLREWLLKVQSVTIGNEFLRSVSDACLTTMSTIIWTSDLHDRLQSVCSSFEPEAALMSVEESEAIQRLLSYFFVNNLQASQAILQVSTAPPVVASTMHTPMSPSSDRNPLNYHLDPDAPMAGSPSALNSPQAVSKQPPGFSSLFGKGKNVNRTSQNSSSATTPTIGQRSTHTIVPNDPSLQNRWTPFVPIPEPPVKSPVVEDVSKKKSQRQMDSHHGTETVRSTGNVRRHQGYAFHEYVFLVDDDDVTAFDDDVSRRYLVD